MKNKHFLLISCFFLFIACGRNLFDRWNGNHSTEDAAFLSQVAYDYGVSGHVDWKDIESGKWSLDQLKIAGENLFIAQFTPRDGVGRPGATGDPSPTRRPLGTDVPFIRTAGPDANSCFSCHRSPSIGGAGDFAVNVFAGLGARQPLMFSTDPMLSAERGTPELNGSIVIEMLAREMTKDLHKIRTETIQDAKIQNAQVKKKLITKGISFGYIVSESDGTLKLNQVKGIDRDLVVRPWGQKGTVTSLRTFTVNANNLHHGMQASERFGYHLTGTSDFDRDGISDELTTGDVTALVVFQAGLNIPGRKLPQSANKQEEILRGEMLFLAAECSSCHVPELVLNSEVFAEPGPYNLEGTLRQQEIISPISINITKDIDKPRVAKENNKLIVRVFTDLKRHIISDSEKPHFGNEHLVEGLTSTDEFITRRLWAVGNTAPYGHRGDLLTIREAIENHGGEARDSRIKFERLSTKDQEAIISFLRSMQVLPKGSRSVVLEDKVRTLPYKNTF